MQANPDLEKLSEFTRQRLVENTGLFDPQVFPCGLFQEMGELGLLGMADLASIARGQAVIAGGTGSLGFATAWASQSLTALALDRLAGLPQAVKAGVRSGDTILALAVSEPKAGAHPKYLSTAAARTAGGWKLDGEKAYVTNGPIASHIAVLAVTSSTAGRNAFSFFLVPAAAQGLTRLEHAQFDFLRPAQHCGFRLASVEVPESALIGNMGKAYEEIVLPFRSLEDAAGSSALSAVLARAARLTAAALGSEINQETALALGELAGIETALLALDAPVIQALQDWNTGTEALGLLLIAIRDLARRSIEILKSAGAGSGDEHVSRILRDAEKYLDIARLAHTTMKMRLGQSYFIPANHFARKYSE
ncbi:MAG: acyl-CoA dehydrogenase family protein [Anaerolineaceae bacterium]|nr:acyl-CoA dehydrogenase family protein [Anaerolineaceae bacterium]